MNVVGTETAGEDLTRYPSGILSLDIRNGHVIPGAGVPAQVITEAEPLPFRGYLILNLGAVGTSEGLPAAELSPLRSATAKYLLSVKVFLRPSFPLSVLQRPSIFSMVEAFPGSGTLTSWHPPGLMERL